jgi:hypothetical protein
MVEFVRSQPGGKDKDAARMGHPASREFAFQMQAPFDRLRAGIRLRCRRSAQDESLELKKLTSCPSVGQFEDSDLH